MPGSVDRDEVRRLVDEEDAVVAEVLPRDEYDWAHIAEAIHLPLKEFSEEFVDERLERGRPVIVYCNDFQ